MLNFTLFIFAALCLTLCGCGFTAGKSLYAKHVIDPVMTDGMTISIQNPDCFSLSIRAGENFLRHYTWNNGTRSAVLTPREDKWSGAYGVYSPYYEWQEHDGVTNLIADESVLNYPSYEQLLCAISSTDDGCYKKYLKYMQEEHSVSNLDFENNMPSALRAGACRAYTDDGLYVAVKKAEGPGNGGTLYVTVYRMMVNSLPVKGLPGSTNERIIVAYPHE